MAATPPPSYTPAPEPHPVRNQRATFSGRVDAFITWFISAIPDVAALAANAFSNATDAAASASTASEKVIEAQAAVTNAQAAVTAAAAAAGATKWIIGTNYGEGICTWSPLDGMPYRHLVAGISNTDPKLDPENWKLQTAAVAVKDEGTGQTTSAASLNFVGDGVTASTVGNDVTVTISAVTLADLHTAQFY